MPLSDQEAFVLLAGGSVFAAFFGLLGVAIGFLTLSFFRAIGFGILGGLLGFVLGLGFMFVGWSNQPDETE